MNYLTKLVNVILVILLLVAEAAKIILISASTIILIVSSQSQQETTTTVNSIETEIEIEIEEIVEEVLETVIENNPEVEWFEQFEIDEEEIESYNLYPELGLAFVWTNQEGEDEVYTTEYFHNYRNVGVIFDNTFCPVILDPEDGYYVKLPCHQDGEGAGLLPLENILKVMMQQNYEAANF